MISAAIFTLNEEINLPHCLNSLKECDDVVVVDSFSSDQTCEIAKKAGARVYQHEFTGFGDQRMWAFENVKFRHPWVLVLDADERVTPELWKEMIERVRGSSEETAAFRLKRRFYWEGKWLRYANLYPSWVVRLVRVGKLTYVNRGHAETQTAQGKIESLEADLVDENHKGLEAWRERQSRYAEQEAMHEASSKKLVCLGELVSSDPLVRRGAWKNLGRRLPFRGTCYFIYAYILRAGWRDGSIGLRFCFEKARFQSRIRKISLRD
jgi:glycosyltransferase involved in cell wall biosynthesis